MDPCATFDRLCQFVCDRDVSCVWQLHNYNDAQMFWQMGGVAWAPLQQTLRTWIISFIKPDITRWDFGILVVFVSSCVIGYVPSFALDVWHMGGILCTVYHFTILTVWCQCTLFFSRLMSLRPALTMEITRRCLLRDDLNRPWKRFSSSLKHGVKYQNLL